MLITYIGNSNSPLLSAIKKVEKKYNVICKRLDYSCTEKDLKVVTVDILFLDLSGYKEHTTPDKLKAIISEAKKNSNVQIIAAIREKEDAYDAFKLKADDVLLYPIKNQTIDEIISEKAIARRHRIDIVTMPDFHISVDGKQLYFPSKKAQEMLAYLVDSNGRQISNNQLISEIWEDSSFDDKARERCRVTFCNLNKVLKENDIDYLIGSTGRTRYINKDEITHCDIYELLKGNEKYINMYNEQYLESYSWSEATKGYIASFIYNYKQTHNMHTN